jgi:hypothetical protein
MSACLTQWATYIPLLFQSLFQPIRTASTSACISFIPSSYCPGVGPNRLPLMIFPSAKNMECPGNLITMSSTFAA